MVEVSGISDDFELQCKTEEQDFSFPISKETIERLNLPLDKIYASEQIKWGEKYIAARPRNENKGYIESIVETAVAYQIDSKYTSFIAVNERDEKLTDIPELQDTVLESPAGWDYFGAGCCPPSKPAMSVVENYYAPPASPVGRESAIKSMSDSLKNSIHSYFDSEPESFMDMHNDYLKEVDENPRFMDETSPVENIPLSVKDEDCEEKKINLLRRIWLWFKNMIKSVFRDEEK